MAPMAARLASKTSQPPFQTRSLALPGVDTVLEMSGIYFDNDVVCDHVAKFAFQILEYFS